MYTIFSAVQRQQTMTEEKLRHDVFWSHSLQRRLDYRFLIAGSSLSDFDAVCGIWS
jgi:hypothetical protein